METNYIVEVGGILMNKPTILELIEQTFSNYPIGTLFTRDEIIHTIYVKHGINKSSIIPSGYCYNITNLGKQADKEMNKFYIFEYVLRGKYKYLGKNYPYSGKVYHTPKGTGEVEIVGEWKNGRYFSKWGIDKAIKTDNPKYTLQKSSISKAKRPSKQRKRVDVPYPSITEVEKYLVAWDKLENYYLQENALNKLFFELCPNNKDISDVLLKASTLNDFYSTNIFSIFPVAKHIVDLDIDERLQKNDETLVDDIKCININGHEKNFYSFATKYCSHHNPNAYPIYDRYVDKVLCYFRDVDGFSEFKGDELKNYKKFKQILLQFQSFYKLKSYNLKMIDKYLWQVGKKYFPTNYK